ncbi:hypothetical protein LTR09_007887 [Extremus antarcticus]|uniref:Uncharacterized protein n=1 Tax=Extremus antarcticus TaxID=702011 RepID=A0AAJ0DBK2_9PEZI|nr:hypothetical protein LTR09_007887 [Extremus antarcticus]
MCNTTTPRRPTGFFDLPLELRAIIYSHVLPPDRTFTFPIRRPEEKTVIALCATHDVLYEETEPLIYKECGASLAITPDEELSFDELPLGIKWDKFQRIDICIKARLDPDDLDNEGLKQAVTSLNYGCPRMLPDITIEFEEEDPGMGMGDWWWTESIPAGRTFCWHYREDNDEYKHPRYCAKHESYAPNCSDCDGGIEDDEEETWLRTVGPDAVPIVATVFDYLLKLPTCKSATLYMLSFLQEDRDRGAPRYHGGKRIFDHQYMDDLCRAMKLWLEGWRIGVDLPYGTYFASTCVERLAS